MAEITINSKVGGMGDDTKKEITIETTFRKQQLKELAAYEADLRKKLNLNSAAENEELTRKLE